MAGETRTPDMPDVDGVFVPLRDEQFASARNAPAGLGQNSSRLTRFV
jgi:hypothetical protein